YELLSEYGFNNAQTNDIYEHLNGESGKLYESNEWRLLRDREALILKNKNEKAECLCNILPLEGYVKITANKDFIIERHSIDKDFNIPRSMNTVCLDMDRIEYPISVRLIQEGDKFVPLGMKNEKLISDYLTDKKRSVYDKESQLVVCSGNKIAWLVNERPDDRFRITDNTRRILKIRVINH
ncbi:MAG: tRNA lysidine(34) synthetase TilS, partial [Paraprevotella sp.]|nr:tRNA lysidine(34) synthetase TilS [Paraprevotella sp.]